MIRRPPRSTQSRSSAASDVYKRQVPISSPSDPAPLGRAASVVRDRGYVLDGTDLEAGRLQAADGGLAAGAGTLHKNVHLAHAVLHGLARCVLGGHLCG